MVITYKLLLDKIFYRTLVDRYYAQIPMPLKLSIQFLFVFILSVCVWAYAWKTTAEWPTIAVWGFLYLTVFSFVGFFFTKWAMIHRFKRSADFNTEVTVSLSDDGISVRGQQTRSGEWAAYPKAVRFSDGMLLMRKHVIRWLPDSAIQEGTPEDATALVQSKTELRHI